MDTILATPVARLSTRVLLNVLFATLLALSGRQSSAGGIGTATEDEGPPSIVNPTPGAFHIYRPGLPGQVRNRDLEFLLDDYYGTGLTPIVRINFDTFGNTLCVNPSNPWGAPYPDMELFYNYFNRINATYSQNTADSTTRFGHDVAEPNLGTYPLRDRCHADIYFVAQSNATEGGHYPSQHIDAAEDSTTGIPRGVQVRPANAVDITGPANILDPLWTQPDMIMNIGAIHEFQHALPSLPVDSQEKGIGNRIFDTEMMSAAAEIITGMQDTTTRFEVPYVTSLVNNKLDGPDVHIPQCAYTRFVTENYQARTLFAAYMASQFRGQNRPLS